MDATPFVTAGLNFIRPEHMGTPTPVKIRDARFAPTPFTLEKNGFTLASHPTALSREEFYEDALVKERYYPELARGLEQLTGATKAFPILHRLRNGDQSFSLLARSVGLIVAAVRLQAVPPQPSPKNVNVWLSLFHWCIATIQSCKEKK